MNGGEIFKRLIIWGRNHELRGFAPLIALLLLMIVGFCFNPLFLSFDNLANLLRRSSFIAVIAVGATFVVTAGGIDLSIGAVVALIAGLVILFLNNGWFDNPYVMIFAAMVVALILGIVCGAINGSLVSFGRLDPFIVTLASAAIARSLFVWMANGGAITIRSNLIHQAYGPLYSGSILAIPVPVVIVVGVAGLGSFLLYRTRFGREVIAIGSNEQVARFSGIDTKRVRLLTYVLLGITVAIGVILYVPRLGSANATTGFFWEFQALTALVIGGTALRGGTGNIWGAICGALILEVIGNIMTLSQFISENLVGAVQGIIIILALFGQRFLHLGDDS